MMPVGPLTQTHREQRLERMIDRLPPRAARAMRWLRRPQARLARLLAGGALVIGGCLAILPIFGLWMLPLGLILLCQDVPPLQRGLDLVLDRIEARHPDWIYGKGAPRS
ncbi:hypothetical protein AA103196_1858 [Ameyamaea chiangmaiensis NBRC 103196]|uniref:Transmembrane protein (PGPGW) n=1 Tax=Ameyamaea chiangmaiensis TaxID=442969 RepID=A0A850PEX6_9PROT|nr:hypothetical protein [Ameyamaea chiangmaiensis]MBS4073877.1 hypothetical protein [Ameyamaea chiangmaiensis]NVN41403.1 hypothetical protein [Ameyamaea chiangmaiensis]GBQ68088.1 hypothetical protein AA103196_1858 [Ameyamaea chiangmaiensis NBRC 103196]